MFINNLPVVFSVYSGGKPESEPEPEPEFVKVFNKDWKGNQNISSFWQLKD